MFATSIMVDPLLTSPRRARNHDDDMAALQRLPALELGQKEEQEEQEEQEQEEDQEEEQEEEDAFQRMMNRGNYLRQLRLLALEDERERLHAREKRATAAARDDFCEEKKEEDFDDDDDDGDAPPPSSSAQGQGQEEEEEPQEEPQEERVATLPDGRRVLDYSSYLAHQRYFDDLKHVDAHFIDYGPILRNFDSNNGIDADCGGCNGNNGNNNNNRLVVEQRKSLGKGGLCWDAAFVLGEHVIARESEWNNDDDDDDDDINATTTADDDGTRRSSSCSSPPPRRRHARRSSRRRRRIVELGAGTGLCGMMLAKATECEVEVTDLPELVGLMEDNVRRNFRGMAPSTAAADDDDDEHPAPVARDGNATARGTVSARTLRWGAEADYGAVPYDVIVGADIVTSLYDAVALARTLHALSGPDTRIYISGKARLDRPHEEFDEAMNELFDTVERIERPVSRLRSNVFIIVAGGRR